MRRRLLATVAFIATLFPFHAIADWIDPGVSYHCDKGNETFDVASIMRTSSPELPGEVSAKPGHSILSMAGEITELTCQLDGIFISATIRRIAARERGQCAAFDHFYLERLQVDGRDLIEHEDLNGGCHSDPTLYEVHVQARRRHLTLTSCRAVWDWNTGYTTGTCTEKQVSIAR